MDKEAYCRGFTGVRRYESFSSHASRRMDGSLEPERLAHAC
jgi:hypothetical protein